VDNKQFSVAFIPVGKQTKVGLIWEKSEPYLAGMRQGDIVLRIDNRIIHTFSDFIRFRFVKGEEHRFYLRDKNGLEKTVVCKIKE
jgi:S1-C subfamily serine protease